ncbi:hypothetical protein LSH36_2021g00000 [Paralvinella palmiformis]|uniref:Uncharacterized protein n=1 Tax=Paralvinella palmiformis TaxID=53620 RepID=A0AAD9IQJ7_9ANNE|nr:hypothetical protein LSH36_2021g00000 [Paralvinella palmiformis]
MPLFPMIGIDGHSQVIAVYLTCTETAAALTHVIFKSYNHVWPHTEDIMIEQNVFSAAFPAVTLQLCLFRWN